MVPKEPYAITKARYKVDGTVVQRIGSYRTGIYLLATSPNPENGSTHRAMLITHITTMAKNILQCDYVSVLLEVDHPATDIRATM